MSCVSPSNSFWPPPRSPPTPSALQHSNTFKQCCFSLPLPRSSRRSRSRQVRPSFPLPRVQGGLGLACAQLVCLPPKSTGADPSSLPSFDPNSSTVVSIRMLLLVSWNATWMLTLGDLDGNRVGVEQQGYWEISSPTSGKNWVSGESNVISWEGEFSLFLRCFVASCRKGGVKRERGSGRGQKRGGRREGGGRLVPPLVSSG